MRKIFAILAFVIMFVVPDYVGAASAVATDTGPPFIYGVAYGHQDEAVARQDSIRRCLKEGGANCTVNVSCSDSGLGAIAVYQKGLGAAVESYGITCGAGTSELARARALHYCEYNLAKKLGISLPPISDTTPDLIRSMLVKECPGLGNCQCATRNEWRD